MKYDFNLKNYPSIEFCKKLTNAGFPKKTDLCITDFGKLDIEFPKYKPFIDQYVYVFPSIAEMIEILPEYIGEYKLEILKDEISYKYYYVSDTLDNCICYDECIGFKGNLAECIAKLILSLKKDNILEFKN